MRVFQAQKEEAKSSALQQMKQDLYHREAEARDRRKSESSAWKSYVMEVRLFESRHIILMTLHYLQLNINTNFILHL
jgi:hypothetical protein